MRRSPALALLPLAALALLATSCSTTRPGGSVVTPTPTKVVGKLPNPNANIPKGDPAAGKVAFAANGCAACHTFTPAAATGKVGPDLDKLAQYAAAANLGTLDAFTRQSILDPGAYVEKGFTSGIMPTTYASLSPQTVSDLVAFLTQGH